MTFKTKREQIYDGRLAGVKRFYYVVYLNDTQITVADTREAAEAKAAKVLLGALECQGNQPEVSLTADGHIVSTREYAPGEVEFVHHRDGRFSGSMISGLEIDGKRVSVKEFHQHYLDSYNAAVGEER